MHMSPKSRMPRTRDSPCASVATNTFWSFASPWTARWRAARSGASQSATKRACTCCTSSRSAGAAIASSAEPIHAACMRSQRSSRAAAGCAKSASVLLSEPTLRPQERSSAGRTGAIAANGRPSRNVVTNTLRSPSRNFARTVAAPSLLRTSRGTSGSQPRAATCSNAAACSSASACGHVVGSAFSMCREDPDRTSMLHASSPAWGTSSPSRP